MHNKSSIIEITYRDVDRTPFIDELIRENNTRLIRTYSHISSCRVSVERNQKHQRGGRPYRVRLDIKVPPGHELVVRKEQTGGDSRAELPSVIKEAFLAARRQLEALKEKQRGEVKKHAW